MVSNKKWIMYHGTGADLENIIKREGLKVGFAKPIFLSAKKEISEQFASTFRGYRSIDDITPRKGIVFQVTIKEEDFQKQLREGTDPRIVDARRENLEKSYKRKDILSGFEYEWYRDIPPSRLKLIKRL